MADADNLRTASLYINNQLLSRGLLRDGDSIDFAGTRQGDEEDAAVSARIISILNDLILRRDRDAEHRESLSISMRALRAENIKLTADLARINDKYTEAQRKADLATAAESTFKTQLKSAESNARALKEDVARMKSLVAQARSSCATEIRRRDGQIDTLKKQLAEAGRSRGTRGNPAITTITVMGEVGNDSNTAISNSVQYDAELRSETKTTLANLTRFLTEENDTLLGVMQQAMAQLRDMSGLVADEKEEKQVCKRPTCEDMAAELDSVMEHMRMILTNPSFVPIEEVVTREEEINRLRRGWVKMESRWKEAVHLMDGWRKRMAASGKPVCDEDLQKGMRLSPVRVNGVDDTTVVAQHVLSSVKEESDENAHQSLRSPCPGNAERYAAAAKELDDAGADSDSDDATTTDLEHHVSGDEHAGNRDPNQQESTQPPDETMKSTWPPERPQPSPLRNSRSAANRGFANDEKPHAESPPTTASKSMRSMPVRPRGLPSQSRTHRPPDAQLPAANTDEASQQHTSPITSSIAAKLAASEKDAHAARLRAKLKAAPHSTRGVSRPIMPTQPPAAEPEKRKRDRKPSKRDSRRRSTLSPWELRALISGE